MPKGSPQKGRAGVSQRKNRGFYSIHIFYGGAQNGC
nr:MAG TPA: hypothetical protein [Caudoviricetes sp.]